MASTKTFTVATVSTGGGGGGVPADMPVSIGTAINQKLVRLEELIAFNVSATSGIKSKLLGSLDANSVDKNAPPPAGIAHQINDRLQQMILKMEASNSYALQISTEFLPD